MHYLKRLATGLGIAGLLASAVMPAIAADSGTVNATATGPIISVNVSPSSFDYGVLQFSTNNTTVTKDTGNESGGLNENLSATNNGNVAEDFTIAGSDATGGSTNWTLVPSLNTTTNQYVHSFNTGTSLGTPTALSTTPQNLGSGNVAVNGTQPFVLQITMPLSGSDPQQHTITTTVVATEHTGP
jgi:hypothetical protein